MTSGRACAKMCCRDSLGLVKSTSGSRPLDFLGLSGSESNPTASLRGESREASRANKSMAIFVSGWLWEEGCDSSRTLEPSCRGLGCLPGASSHQLSAWLSLSVASLACMHTETQTRTATNTPSSPFSPSRSPSHFHNDTCTLFVSLSLSLSLSLSHTRKLRVVLLLASTSCVW